MKRFQRTLALVVCCSMLNVSMLQSAQAAMVSTEEVARLAATSSPDSGHARLAAVLARDNVRSEMERLGIDPASAQERVAALTDEEAAWPTRSTRRPPVASSVPSCWCSSCCWSPTFSA